MKKPTEDPLAPPQQKIKFNFKPNDASGKLETDPSIVSKLEEEKTKPIQFDFFKKHSDTRSNSPFIIKPNREKPSNETVLVDQNPLSSSKALKKVREAQEEDTPPEKFSLFDLKGNSKAREEANKKFNFQSTAPMTKFEFKPMPELKPQTTTVNLFKFAPSSSATVTDKTDKVEEVKTEGDKPKIAFTFAPFKATSPPVFEEKKEDPKEEEGEE